MKLQTIPTVQSGVTTAAAWDTVKYWATLAGKFQHASVAAQVMCGFALTELKKKHGIRQGKRTDLQLPDQSGSSPSWETLVEQYAGISDDTAGNWMKMSDGIKSRWKKLAPQEKLKELMAVPPSQWSEDDTKLVSDSLHEVTDGQTQTDFMRELGLAKKKPGNPNATGPSGPQKKLSTAEAAAEMRRIALEDSGRMGMVINASNRNFVLLTDVNDLEVDAQIAVLEFALKLRKKWLAIPKGKRDAKEIEAMISDWNKANTITK